MSVKWIPIEKIEPFIGYESFFFGLMMTGLAFSFYKIFLKKLSERRHGQLRHRFMMTSGFILISGLMGGLFELSSLGADSNIFFQKLASYLGLMALLIGAVAIIKISQIYVYLYLFFSNISTGVPRLIGNLFTFIFSVFLFGLIASHIFSLNITAFAATSAVFSLVLGLAMQDTLGNFFSGLALQLDRPFQINDWVEIQEDDQKWIGQIQEINWRATYLLTFSDELIIVPNRTIAQSKIMMLSNETKPVRLNQVFRFPFDTPTEDAKAAILEALQGFSEIMTNPSPRVLITETSESWITVKVFYSIYDYGMRFRIGDALITEVLKSLKKHQLKLAHTTLTIQN